MFPKILTQIFGSRNERLLKGYRRVETLEEWLRDEYFAYHTSLPDQGEDARYAEFVRSAYHQSDLDTVRIIRMIAESGGLQQ